MKYIWEYNTKIGNIYIAEEDNKITNLYFKNDVINENVTFKETDVIKEAYKELEEYLNGKRNKFDIVLNPKGTDFQKRVWKELCNIPYGCTRTYKEIAKLIENDKAMRAVGMANNKNPIPIFIPCHRVIGTNGKLVGYRGGIKVKEILLDIERREEKMNINDYRYIAHRGIYDNDNGIIENSLYSFNRAIEENVPIEFDVRLTSDNNIIVFHDVNLKRLTGLDKNVSECTLEEIKELRLLDTESKIPTLDEVLSLIDGKVPILIEIKNEDKVGKLEKLLMERLKSYNGKYIIESFNLLSIVYIKNNYKNVEVGQLLSR